MFVTKKMPRSLSAEAYRSLRTRIKFSSVDKKLKTIVVTSPLQGEGKSTIAGNLAYTLSQDGARVLVVDCNLRNPSIHYNFSISNEKGITDVLVGDADLKDVIKNVDNSLFLITAGTIPPNPSEILGSNLMKELLNELSNGFDFVIIDSSPILTETDTLLLTAIADGTIVVVKARMTKEKMIKQTYEQLMESKANVIGTILNECDKSIDNKYYRCYSEAKSKIGNIFNNK